MKTKNLVKLEEIERLVAEHVMDVKNIRWEDHAFATINNKWHPYWMGTHNGKREPLHRYARDISAAWEVVEKLEGEGFFWHAACTENGVTFIFYRGSESYIGDDPGPSCIHLAEAICRAALKARGAEIES